MHDIACEVEFYMEFRSRVQFFLQHNCTCTPYDSRIKRMVR